MNKQELIEAVAKECEVSKACGEKAVNAVLSGIKSGVKKGKEVRLIGFGTFSVRSRKARKGRNPQTGAVINIKRQQSGKIYCWTGFQEYRQQIDNSYIVPTKRPKACFLFIFIFLNNPPLCLFCGRNYWFQDLLSSNSSTFVFSEKFFP